MKLSKLRCALGASVLVALVAPMSASAVPGVYSVEAKTGNAGVTFTTDPTGAALTNTQTQYTVAADGFVLGLSENNAATGGGVIDYKALPEEYRAPMTAEQIRTYGPAQTDVQPHATCSGVAALESGATILAWQGDEPYYAYVPWQKASAGLGDDPADWIPVVEDATGVDLATLSTEQALTQACTTLGGAYEEADSPVALATGLIAAAVAPVQKQVTSLKDEVSKLKKAKDKAESSLVTEKDARKAAEVAYQEQWNRSLDLKLASKRFDSESGVAALVTGSIGDPVTLTLELTRKQARSLGVESRFLVETTVTIGSQGAAIATLKPTKADARKLAKHKGRIPVKVRAASGSFSDVVGARLAP